MAEGVGFEPTFAFTKTVFKTVAIVHSATPPKHPSIGNRILFGKLTSCHSEGAKRPKNLSGGQDTRFFAEFTLSQGTFFDKLRMSGDEGLRMTGEKCLGPGAKDSLLHCWIMAQIYSRELSISSISAWLEKTSACICLMMPSASIKKVVGQIAIS
jgi:hypothetical protein